MSGLHAGLKAGWPQIASTLGDYTNRIGAMGADVGVNASGFGSPSLAGAGGGSSSRSITIAPGAVQITFPGGTSATPADVEATVNRGLKALADELARR
jgi:hypothetical protein